MKTVRFYQDKEGNIPCLGTDAGWQLDARKSVVNHISELKILMATRTCIFHDHRTEYTYVPQLKVSMRVFDGNIASGLIQLEHNTKQELGNYVSQA
jgi:hypothetical protein